MSDKVFRISETAPDDHYVKLSNDLARSKLAPNEFKLLAYMLSQRDGEMFIRKSAATRLDMTRDAVRSAIRGLESGYDQRKTRAGVFHGKRLVRQPVLASGGNRVGTNFYVSDSPLTDDLVAQYQEPKIVGGGNPVPEVAAVRDAGDAIPVTRRQDYCHEDDAIPVTLEDSFKKTRRPATGHRIEGDGHTPEQIPAVYADAGLSQKTWDTAREYGQINNGWLRNTVDRGRHMAHSMDRFVLAGLESRKPRETLTTVPRYEF